MRAAASLHHVEPGGSIARSPGSASGVVITATDPGGPTLGTICGGRPRAAPIWSRRPATLRRSVGPKPRLGRLRSPSAKGTCAITAAPYLTFGRGEAIWRPEIARKEGEMIAITTCT